MIALRLRVLRTPGDSPQPTLNRLLGGIRSSGWVALRLRVSRTHPEGPALRDEDNRRIGRASAGVSRGASIGLLDLGGRGDRGGGRAAGPPAKVGKTTLLSLLLDHRRAGGDLRGRTASPGKTVLSSEENDSLWGLRQPPLDSGPSLIFHTPAGDCPSHGRWKRFINDLLVIDSAGRRQ
jgi:hypothetical protein